MYHYRGQVWTANPIARGLGAADVTAGEDPTVRQATVEALGDLNGTAVVVDPNNGRILAMVNQELAISADYQPCSTTKLAIAIAGLDRGVINENTPVQIGRHYSMNLTQALAHSNNQYFEALGDKLGFDTVARYERLLGLGEYAGYNIPGEDPGYYPNEPGPGGVAKLSSFGEGIRISPLQLAAIVTAIANGGTMYYLQHPTNQYEVEHFAPKVKRTLNIGAYVPEVEDGMMAAVQHGTARLARLSDEEIMGKTGTCSRGGTRYGLFASYLTNPISGAKMVLVVILRGNRAVFGPRAAEVAGQIYRSLDAQRYFVETQPTIPAMAVPALAH
jgi:penicillin-binding protein 2